MFMYFHFNAIRSSDLKIEIQNVILLDDSTNQRIFKLQHTGASFPSKTLKPYSSLFPCAYYPSHFLA